MIVAYSACCFGQASSFVSNIAVDITGPRISTASNVSAFSRYLGFPLLVVTLLGLLLVESLIKVCSPLQVLLSFLLAILVGGFVLT